MRSLLVAVTLAACGPTIAVTPKPDIGCAELAKALREDHRGQCIQTSVRDAPEQVASELATTLWSDALETRLTEANAEPADWLAVAQQLVQRDPKQAEHVHSLAERPTRDPQLRQAIALQRLVIAQGLQDDKAIASSWKALTDLAADSPAFRSQLITLATTERHPSDVEALCRDHVDAMSVWSCLRGDPGNIRAYIANAVTYATITAADARTIAAADSTEKAFPGMSCLTDATVLDPRTVIKGKRPESTPDEVRLYYRLRDVFADSTSACFLSQAAAACYGLIEEGKSCPLSFVVADYFHSLNGMAQQDFFSTLVDMKRGHYHELGVGNSHERIVLLHLHLVLAEIVLDRGKTANELDMSAYHLARALTLMRDLHEPDASLRELVAPSFRKEICQRPNLGCDRTCRDPYVGSCNATCDGYARKVSPSFCAP